jgi:hypothetical protein
MHAAQLLKQVLSELRHLRSDRAQQDTHTGQLVRHGSVSQYNKMQCYYRNCHEDCYEMQLSASSSRSLLFTSMQ